MFILAILRLAACLVSLAVLSIAVWLLWTWQAGEVLYDPGAGLVVHRDPWRLWTGLALLAWSFLGRFVATALVARPDREGGLSPAPRRQGLLGAPSGDVLYVQMFGPEGARPIILTHGWGLDASMWRYATRDLAGRHQLVLWDLPGLGRSRAASHAPITLERYAADLAFLIEQTGPKKPVLVGHSIGGMIIQTLLRDRPDLQDRIAGVVLANTTYANPLRTMALSRLWLALQKPLVEPLLVLAGRIGLLLWPFMWQSYLSGWAHLSQRAGFGRFVTRSQLEQTTRLVTRNPPSIQAMGNRAMLRWDAQGALGRTRLPALIIGASADIVTRPEASHRIAGETAQGRLQIVEGANHMGPLERHDLYNLMIATFAEGLASPRQGHEAQGPIQRGGFRPTSARGQTPRPSQTRPTLPGAARQPPQAPPG